MDNALPLNLRLTVDAIVQVSNPSTESNDLPSDDNGHDNCLHQYSVLPRLCYPFFYNLHLLIKTIRRAN